MKTIEVDDELPIAILPATLCIIGESASGHFTAYAKILPPFPNRLQPVSKAAPTLAPAPVAEVKPANPVKDVPRHARDAVIWMNTPSRSAR